MKYDRTRLLGGTLVAAQFGLIALLLLLPADDHWSVSAWLQNAARGVGFVGLGLAVVAALSLGRSLTPMPIPNEHASLRTTGLYSFARHPIYSGLILWAVASSLQSGSLIKLMVGAAFITLMSYKARWEEEKLRQRFVDYADYCRHVGRFFPLVGRHRSE